jgi:hypothetical protein
VPFEQYGDGGVREGRLMAQSGFTWQVAPTQTFPQLYDRYTQTIFLSGNRVAYIRAKEGEQWMKVNAPWQDRTGAARAGLHVNVLERSRQDARLYVR